MEKIPEDNDTTIKTESVQAGFLKNGDIIFLGDEEFDVVDVDHQLKNSFIRVKDRQGKIQEIYSYHFVKKVILDSLN